MSLPATGGDDARVEALLDARARALALRGRTVAPGSAVEAASGETYLVCAAGAERYGLPLAATLRVMAALPCTPLPGAPAALSGLIADDGAIVGVIDLAAALGLPGASPRDAPGRYVRLRETDPPLALAVGEVLGLARVAPTAILAPSGGPGVEGSGTASGLGTAAVSGYCPPGSDIAAGMGAGVEADFSVIDLPRLLRPFLP